jgi:isopropylmalate/homocitrate/citramalate synthase
MNRGVIEIDRKVIERAIEKLGFEDKVKILRTLARETREERWRNFVSKIRENAKKVSISDEDVKEICEIVRNKVYEKKIKNCS